MEKSQLDILTRPLSRGISRRAALRGLGGSLAAGLVAAGLGKTSAQTGETAPHPASSHETEAAAAPAGEPQLREFTLTASEFDHEIMPGTAVRAWGYNGQVPGPELRVTEGDTVRVTLRNELSVPTTIHWHGVHLPPAMDGPAGLNQAAVEPGDEFVYEFTARPLGTRWYHSHADPALQVPMGLYGPLIIEPRIPTRFYDRDYTWVLGEWDLELTPDVAAGRAERGPRDRELRGGELGADLFLINGRTHGAIPPLKLATGDRVLVRLINAGHMAHPIHLHGHSFKIVATDGNPVAEVAQLTKDTVLIGPAERYDLEFVGDNPGVWMVHCHIEHHMANGMMTTIQYDGYEPTGPAAEDFADLHAPAHGAPPSQDEPVEAPAAESAETTEEPAAASDEAAAPAGEGAEIQMVDDRFQPAALEVPAGTTVTWIHKGHDWHSVKSSAAGFASPKMGPGDTFSFTFETPGAYRYVCSQHGLGGMSGQVTVT